MGGGVLVPNKCQGGAIYILVPTKCQDGAIREIIIWCQTSAIWEVVFWCQEGAMFLGCGRHQNFSLGTYIPSFIKIGQEMIEL